MGALRLFLVLVLVVLTACACSGATVGVFFHSRGSLRGALREVPIATPEAALEALMTGPTPTEKAAGVTSSIPATWYVTSIAADGAYLVIDLGGAPEGSHYGDTLLDEVIAQFDRTLGQFGLTARLLAGGKPFSALRIPSPDPGKRAEPIAPRVDAQALGALAGKKVCVSPGHGYLWTGGNWGLQRPVYCAPLAEEDLHNIDIVEPLIRYLEADGATVIYVREQDKNRGDSPWGLPWWKMSAPPYLYDKGYPATVYSPTTGAVPGAPGMNQSDEDRRSRPLACNYDSGDVCVSIHTNGLNGDCTGPTCRTGMEMFYDSTKAGSNGGAAQSLAAACMSASLSTVNTCFGPYGCSRGCAPIDYPYAEVHYPTAPACLFEVGYHDTCDRDAMHLRDPLFTSATMHGIYAGICQYLGVTPTCDAYSAEYVSDDIPDSIQQYESRTVHITFRNRGVAWSEAHQFRLGAVGDSDSFAGNRQMVSGTVGPGKRSRSSSR